MWSYLTRSNTHVAGAEEIEPLLPAYRCGWPQHAYVVVLTLLSGGVDVQGLRLALPAWPLSPRATAVYVAELQFAFGCFPAMLSRHIA